MRPTTSRSLAWFQQQFQIQSGKPAYSYGVRMLLVLSGPIVAGFLLNNPGFTTISTIAAFSVGLVVVSGTYQQQAKAMGGAAIAVTFALLLANLVSSNIWLSLAATFAVVFLLSFASLWGAVATSISVTTLLMFVISLAKFSTLAPLSMLIEQCLLCLLGGLWGMAIASVFWIVRPYTPAVEAVADCYGALSTIAQFITESLSTTSASTLDSEALAKQEAQTKEYTQAQDAAIQNLSMARDIWTSAWSTEKADSPRGNQLLGLIEDANQINHTLVALAELIANAAQGSLFQNIQLEIKQTVEQVTIALHDLSTALKQKQSSKKRTILLETLEESTKTLKEQWQGLIHQIRAQTIQIQPDDYREIICLGKIVSSLSDLSEQIKMSAESAPDIVPSPGGLAPSTTKSIARPKQFLLTQPEAISWLDTIKNNLTFRSVTFRHALRLAILITFAELLGYAFPIPKGYWVTLTVLLALKPNFGGTSQMMGQRALGTVVGGILGIVLVMIVHNSVAIALLILLMMFAAMSLRPLSYSLFVAMLTPAIVLLFGATSMGNWEVGIQRIAYTLIGGAIAFGGSYLLFPSWEQQQLPAQLEMTLRANLAYFQVAIRQYLQQAEQQIQEPQGLIFARSLDHLRHQAALQNANAEAAAQRLFGEPRHIRGEIEPIMALMLYIRSLFNSTAILIEDLKKISDENQFAHIEQLTNALEQVLLNLADAIAHRQTLQPLPPLDDYLEPIYDRVHQLHVTRLSEMTVSPAQPTETLQAVRTQTLLTTELSRIVRIVKGLHITTSRLEAVYETQNS